MTKLYYRFILVHNLSCSKVRVNAKKETNGKTCSSHITLIFNQYTSYLVVVLMSSVLQYTIYNLVVVFYMLYTV